MSSTSNIEISQRLRYVYILVYESFMLRTHLKNFSQIRYIYILVYDSFMPRTHLKNGKFTKTNCLSVANIQFSARRQHSRDPSAAWLGRLRPSCAAASSASPPPAALPRPGPGVPLLRAPTPWTRSTPTSTSGLCTPTSVATLLLFVPAPVLYLPLIHLFTQRGHHMRIRQHVNPLSSSFSVKHS